MLSSYSIEADHRVLLSFFDGTNVRCRPDDLTQYLTGPDLEKVNQALKLRKDFIKRVLPPTAMVLLLGATIALGRYDYHRYQQALHKPAPSTSVAEPQKSRTVTPSVVVSGEQSATAPVPQPAAEPAQTAAPSLMESISQLSKKLPSNSAPGKKNIKEKARNAKN